MKILILTSLVCFSALQADSQFAYVEKSVSSPHYLSYANHDEDPDRVLQLGTDGGRMSAVVFKNQEYCRAELERFDFEAHFSVVGATVYFSGANFRNLEKGTITSSSLKPIKELMLRCVPGSIVVFDEVKVVGPDKKLRTIPGATYILY